MSTFLTIENHVGENIIHFAVQNDCEEDITDYLPNQEWHDLIVLYLLNHLKTSPEIFKDMILKSDMYGNTPLMVGAKTGFRKNMQSLFQFSRKLNVLDTLLMIENNEGQNIMHLFNWGGDHDNVEYFLNHLKRNSKIDKEMFFKSDLAGNTPLMYAAKYGLHENFESLFEEARELNNFDTLLMIENNKGQNIIHFAVQNGDKNIIYYLLNYLKANRESFEKMLLKSDMYGNTLLMLAANKGSSENFRSLIEVFRKLNVLDTLLMEICKKTLLKSDLEGNTPLMIAAEKNGIKKFQSVFETARELNILDALLMIENCKGQNIIHSAVQNDYNVNITDYLLNHLIQNPKICEKMLFKSDVDGNTSLMVAANTGFLRHIQSLFQVSRKLSVLDTLLAIDNNKNQNILHFAVQNKRDKIITSYLLNYLKSNPEICKKMLLKSDLDGNTPSMLATNKGRLQISRFLREVSE